MVVVVGGGGGGGGCCFLDLYLLPKNVILFSLSFLYKILKGGREGDFGVIFLG